MVKYSTIIKVIESEVWKCYPTVSEMRSILSKMGSDEKYEQLKEQGLLNRLEVDDYEEAVDVLEFGEDVWNDATLEEATEKVFFYERRLIEGLKRREPPTVDIDDFNRDNQFIDDSDLESKMGEFEKRQIDDQERRVNGDTVTDMEWYAINGYIANSNWINDSITHTKYLYKLDGETKKTVQEMDSTINKSNGLLDSTVLYRGGKLPNIHLKIGDHSKFKRYTSTSFQERVGSKWNDSYDDFLFTIYAPKGTKGLSLNAPYFENAYVDEHEWLLPRNTGFTVLDIDYEDRTISVVLDEP